MPYYRPKKTLTQKEQSMKEQAQKIISDISQGKEQVMTTVVHISEMVNILKNGMQREMLTQTILGLFYVR
jgi:uncharacterized protein